MFKNILVAVDGSATSIQGLNTAIELAKPFGATLHLLHVVREMQLPKELQKLMEVESIKGPRQNALNAVGEQILNQAKRVAQSKGVKAVEDSLGSGDPANSIVKYAERNKVDLIVMGSRGLGHVEGMLLGSVSRKVSSLAKAPCLIAK
ncbi:MAG: universal stress protein [Rhodospirillales bacterium]|nr:universal stress protein [Rhodospirillales bacterium]